MHGQSCERFAVRVSQRYARISIGTDMDLEPDPLLHEVPLQISQSAYPYLDLMETNRKRTRNEFRFELIGTGIFNDDRYFDASSNMQRNFPKTY
jgi:hypothetical protein